MKQDHYTRFGIPRTPLNRNHRRTDARKRTLRDWLINLVGMLVVAIIAATSYRNR